MNIIIYLSLIVALIVLSRKKARKEASRHDSRTARVQSMAEPEVQPAVTVSHALAPPPAQVNIPERFFDRAILEFQRTLKSQQEDNLINLSLNWLLVFQGLLFVGLAIDHVTRWLVWVLALLGMVTAGIAYFLLVASKKRRASFQEDHSFHDTPEDEERSDRFRMRMIFAKGLLSLFLVAAWLGILLVSLS